MTETKTPAAWTIFEVQTCPRCYGSGTYSYTQTWGTACFTCGQPHVPGRGEVLTARGVAASRFLTSILSRRAGDLSPGDAVRPPRRRRFVRIETIGPDTGKFREGDGPWITMGDRGYLAIRTPGYQWGAHCDELVRVAVSAETKTAARALALRYQALLTKRGTERKSKAAQAEIAAVRAEAAALPLGG